MLVQWRSRSSGFSWRYTVPQLFRWPQKFVPTAGYQDKVECWGVVSQIEQCYTLGKIQASAVCDKWNQLGGCWSVFGFIAKHHSFKSDMGSEWSEHSSGLMCEYFGTKQRMQRSNPAPTGYQCWAVDPQAFLLSSVVSHFE